MDGLLASNVSHSNEITAINWKLAQKKAKDEIQEHLYFS